MQIGTEAWWEAFAILHSQGQILSWFMEEPIYSHWKALKRVLRYVQGMLSLGLLYSRTEDYKLVGYSDSDWYKQCPHEHSLYTKKSGGNVIFVTLYVDDLIFLGNNDEMIEEFKSTMMREFEMTDLGLLKIFFGLGVKQGETCIFISQEKSAKEILKKYKI